MSLLAAGRSAPAPAGGGTARFRRVYRRRNPWQSTRIALLAFLLSGCHLMRPIAPVPSEGNSYDEALRGWARQERYEAAIERTGPEYADEAGDDLLRLLHRGLLQHYAGDYVESNATLQQAEALAEDRYTRSISRALLSLVTNDRALAWIPNRTERLMVSYFGALNYLALRDVEEAAVEARRLSYFLERTEELELDHDERALRRGLRYFAGAVFEAAGERNDAAVAYRHVWPEGRPSPPTEAADGTAAEGKLELEASLTPGGWEDLAAVDRPREPDPFGEVVVVVESGFVARRVERTRKLSLYAEEVDALDSSDTGARFGVASCVAARDFADVLTSGGRGRQVWMRRDGGRCATPAASGERGKKDGRDRLEIRIAWPAMERSGLAAGRVMVAATLLRSAAATTAAGVPPVIAGKPESPGSEAGATEAAPGPPLKGARGVGPGVRTSSGISVDLSGAVIEEYEDGLELALVKTIARSAGKYALARMISRELAEEDEVLGDIAEFTAAAAVALFERADTRSWHLLPGELSVARLRLPTGTHAVTLELVGDLGGPRLVNLGDVEVGAGDVRVLATRVWP